MKIRENHVEQIPKLFHENDTAQKAFNNKGESFC